MQTKRLQKKKNPPMLLIALSMICMTFDVLANCDMRQCNVCILAAFDAHQKRIDKLNQNIGVVPTDQEKSEPGDPMTKAFTRNHDASYEERDKAYEACRKGHGDSCVLNKGMFYPSCIDAK